MSSCIHKPGVTPIYAFFSSLREKPFQTLQQLFSQSMNYYVQLCPQTTEGKTQLLYYGTSILTVSFFTFQYLKYQENVLENKILSHQSVITEKKQLLRDVGTLFQRYEEEKKSSNETTRQDSSTSSASSSLPPESTYEKTLTTTCLQLKESFTRDIQAYERKINKVTAKKAFYASFHRFSLFGALFGALTIALPLAHKIKSLQ